jgi:predicted component of type VI protein secretion system
MRFCVRIITGKDAGREIPIRGPRFLIGCAESCDLKMHAVQVSPFHCALLIQDESIWVRDYGGGTIVGGTQIVGRRRLNHGDQLQVGSLQFELLIENAAEKGNDRVLDEGEILDLLSQPLSNVRSELSTVAPGAHSEPTKHPEPADSADAASDILKKLFMPKVAFNATVHATAAITAPSPPPPDDEPAPRSGSPIETVALPGVSVASPRRRGIALPQWMFAADGQLNPNVMFSLGVWTGLGLCSVVLGCLWVFWSLSGGSAPYQN